MFKYLFLIINIVFFLIYKNVFAIAYPKVIFNITPTIGGISTVFNIDASASVDSLGGKNLFYRINCGDPESFYFTAYSAQNKFTCKYNDVITTYITVEVLDKYTNLSSKAMQKIIVRESSTPKVSIFVDKESAFIGEDINISVVGFSMINTDKSLLQYKYDFDFDGTDNWDTDWTSQTNQYHSYNSPGNKILRVAVKDIDGSIGYAIGYKKTNQNILDDYVNINTITINEKNKFNVIINISNQNPVVGEEVDFDIDTKTYDRNTTYRWDFDGDGNWDTSFLFIPKSSFIYNVPGTYYPKLEITKDNQKYFFNTQINVNIGSISNKIYDAKITIYPEHGSVNTDFKFNISARTIDNTKYSVRWDFDGDGIWDTNFGNYYNVNYKYNNIGNYNIIAQLMDNVGNILNIKEILIVTQNIKPNVKIEVNKNKGTTSTVFEFKAINLYQTQNVNMQYAWDFDGDGLADTSFMPSNYQKYQYNKIGNYNVTVFVKNKDNVIGQDTTFIQVLENTPPIVIAKLNRNIGFLDDRFELDLSGSTDREESSIYYKIDWDYKGPQDNYMDINNWTIINKFSYLYKDTGDKTIRILAKDKDGDIVELIRKVNVFWGSQYVRWAWNKNILKRSNYEKSNITQPMTRAEAIKIFVIASNKKLNNTTNIQKIFKQYKNLDPNAWYARYVAIAIQENIIPSVWGYDLQLDKPINKIDTIFISAKLFDIKLDYNLNKNMYLDVHYTSWIYPYANISKKYDLIYTGKNNYLRPFDTISKIDGIRIAFILSNRSEISLNKN